jgi:hypothetical protein
MEVERGRNTGILLDSPRILARFPVLKVGERGNGGLETIGELLIKVRNITL